MEFSSLDKVNLRWLTYLLSGFLSFELILMGSLVLGINFSEVPGRIDTILSAFLVGLIFLTGFFGMRQPEIFREVNELEPSPTIDTRRSQNNEPKGKPSKYQSSNFRDEDKQAVADKLQQLMQKEQLFLDRFLDLRRFAERSGYSTHQVSECLNQTLRSTFYDFVNGYRVEEAKHRLQTSNDTILDIALAVGFNNKATFNKSFKKQVNLTPSEFRKLNQ